MITQIDLVKSYVQNTGQKVYDEKDMEKVQKMFPKEWLALQKLDNFKKELWESLPKDIQSKVFTNRNSLEELYFLSNFYN